jgi:hypothetical protein
MCRAAQTFSRLARMLKPRSKPTRKILSAAIATLGMAGGTAFAADTLAPWLTQVRITNANLAAANWGKNQLLGVVDTGIDAGNTAFAPGQVSLARSACAGVSFGCATGIADDYGHGTAVAAIAAGSQRYPFSMSYGAYPVSQNAIVSVAPYANIVAQKVFAAGAASTFTDVANGISKAADAGASVINVSISYWNGAEVVSAINYAASKGSFIVWAGGNEGTALLNGASTAGLSAAAIKQLVFAGAVDPRNALSYFSNQPGAGKLVNTSGSPTSYAARWVMAPGESILAPNVASGPEDWSTWSGTSMAAPIVSGSLILLESAWPILKTRRTAATLLLSTTTDLGAKGVDATFGSGLINLESAFRPYGALTVTQANGRSIAVSSLSGSLITGGALGSLSTVKSKLANYTALDGFQRNYSVDLSGLIRSRPVAASVNPLPTNAPSGPQAMKFGLNPDIAQDRRVGYTALTETTGTTLAFGYGVPVQLSYARALYGNEDMARLSGELGVTHLAALAQGGGMAAYGMQLSDATRIAFSWSGTESVLNGTPASWNEPWTNSDAASSALGLTHRFNDAFTGGLTVGTLNENHGLLGSAYDANSPLSLGASNRSRSFGLSAAFTLDRSNSVLFEAGFATTAAASAGGLFAGTTDLQSRSYGVTFMSRSLVKDQDQLTLSVKQPLRVVSGQAGVIVPAIDEQGIAHFNTEWASLVPTGREVHYAMSYDAPLNKTQSLGFQAGYRKDVQNIQGATDVSLGAMWTMKF